MTDSQLVDAAIALAALVLLFGFLLAGLWWGAAAAVVVAALWVAGHTKKRRWASPAGLFSLALLTAIGLIIGLAPGWGIAALAASLAAWELDYFWRVLDDPDRAKRHLRVEQRDALIRRHRRRVLLVCFAGALLAGAATVIQVQFGFGLALLLGVISLAGISRAVHFLRR